MLTFKQFINESKYSIGYHVTPEKNVPYIMKEGLKAGIGGASSSYGEQESRAYFFPTIDDVKDALTGWMADEYEDDILSLLKVDLTGLTMKSDVAWEIYTTENVTPNRITIISEDIDSDRKWEKM